MKVGAFAVLAFSLLQSALGAVRYSKQALNDEVDWKTLPGAADITELHDRKTFAGYIPVETNGAVKNIFYWFFESRGEPSKDPLLLWTNGGPGCSGMLGLLTEHGPMLVRDRGSKLEANPYSWNKLANMLYVEIPCGVGFSYSDTVSSYTTGDTQTALDNVAFLQGWLKRFDGYRNTDLHLSSESYGGHYLPTLALALVDSNNAAAAKNDKAAHINFKGLLVGNPYTDWASNQIGMYTKYWGEQLISKPLYDEWYSVCVDGGYRGDLPKCQSLELEMDAQIGGLNPYALDFPVCSGSEYITAGGVTGVTPTSTAQAHALRQAVKGLAPPQQRTTVTKTVATAVDTAAAHLLMRVQAAQSAPLKAVGDSPPYEPCAQSFTSMYLNDPAVVAALHAKSGIAWIECSDKVQYSAADVRAPMMPNYNKLIDNNPELKVLVFSGDDDAVCATTGTQWWIYDLGYKIATLWKPWSVSGQIAGFVTQFEGFTFVTVHSAGHEVPAYQPERALALLQRYLDGSWFV